MRQLKRKSLKKHASTKTGGKKSMKKTKKVMKKRGGFFSRSELPGKECKNLATNVDKAVCQYLKMNYYKFIKNEEKAKKHETRLNTLKDNFTDEETKNYNEMIKNEDMSVSALKTNFETIDDAQSRKMRLNTLQEKKFDSYIGNPVRNDRVEGNIDGWITHITYKNKQPIFHVKYFQDSIDKFIRMYINNYCDDEVGDAYQECRIEKDAAAHNLTKKLRSEWTKKQVDSSEKPIISDENRNEINNNLFSHSKSSDPLLNQHCDELQTNLDTAMCLYVKSKYYNILNDKPTSDKYYEKFVKLAQKITDKNDDDDDTIIHEKLKEIDDRIAKSKDDQSQACINEINDFFTEKITPY